MKKEIEILWKLNDTRETAIKKLAGMEFIKEKEIVDYYFYDPMRKDLQPDKNMRLSKCLRVRVAKNGSSITYKNDHFNAGVWLYSDEIESDTSDAKNIISILEHLGFEKLITVDVKKFYFRSGPYEIALEKVKGLGLYLEVEYHSQKEIADVLAIKKKMREFVVSRGFLIGAEENAGKPELLLRKKIKK